MRKKRQISFKECYSILEISKGATLEEVKRAYRRRAFELHPDLNPDDPDAVRKFQDLNEAYVALSQVLQTEEAAREAATAEEKRREQARKSDRQQTADSRSKAGATDAKEAGAAASGDAQSGQSAQSGASAQSGQTSQSGQSGRAEASNATAGGSAQSRAASAAYGQEDVLRDLLNDPFARRVFEDIYREVNRQTQPETPPASETPPPSSEVKPKPVTKKVQMEWGQRRLSLDFSKGVGGVVKNWLRRQIDEEQTFVLPALSLRPGVRLRLQIRRGLSEELCTIEVTLPKDFVVGKPVRLRGLGKKVGAWQGDLYLTFQAK